MNSSSITYQGKGKLTPAPHPRTSAFPFNSSGYVVRSWERKDLPGFRHEDASVILLARMEQEVDPIRVPFHPALGRTRIWPISPILEVGEGKKWSHCTCLHVSTRPSHTCRGLTPIVTAMPGRGSRCSHASFVSLEPQEDVTLL